MLSLPCPASALMELTMPMTEEERDALKNTVQLAVQKGNEPIWEKLHKHDTDIALHKQDMTQSKDSQIARGTRLGTVERKVDRVITTARVTWVIAGIIAAILGWLISLSS